MISRPKPARAKRPASLNATNGTLRIDGCRTALGPRLTRAAFLASPLAAAASDLVVNERWHSWQLPGSRIDGLTFLVGVFYEGERLDMIQLFLQDPRYGTSWEDMTEEKEEARRVAQWDWLRSQLGNAGKRVPSTTNACTMLPSTGRFGRRSWSRWTIW
jgi:hypothetical protein